MKSLFQKCIVVFVVFSLTLSQVVPVWAQDTTPETPTPTSTETGSPETSDPELTTTATPSPTVTLTNGTTTTPTVTATPEMISTTPLLEIELSATPETVKQNGEITLDWKVIGIEKPDAALTLQLNLPDGFEPTKENTGKFDSQNKIIHIPLSELSGTINLQAVDQITEDAVFLIGLYDEKQVLLCTNQVIVPLREKFNVAQNGGEITARDGELKVKFNQESIENEEIEVEIGNPAGNGLPYSLSGKPFEITAKTKNDEIDVSSFDVPIEFEINLTEYDFKDAESGDIYLYWFNPETKEWEGMASWVDEKTNTLHGFTTHFSIFDIGPNNWEAAKLPNMEGFQVSNFTGAGTYSFPIEVPPGPGGLQPNISLNYNSQVIDQATSDTQASWAGMGWSLDTGSITRNTNNTTNTEDDTFSLSVNGISSTIIKTSNGEYHLADENFMKIQFSNGTWSLKDKTGNTYYFEYALSMAYQSTCGSVTQQQYRWLLTRIENTVGKQLVYEYAKETKNITYGCSTQYTAPTDVNAYPTFINYPDAGTRLRFEVEARNDYNASWVTDQIHHSYSTKRLNQILIERLNAGGTYTVMKGYDLNYAGSGTNKIWPNMVSSGGGSPLTLNSIQECGYGCGNFLPATLFGYGDLMHLTEVQNGYGGTTVFDYERWFYSADTRPTYKSDYGPYAPLGANGVMIHNFGTNGKIVKPGGVYLLLGAASGTFQFQLYDGFTSQTTTIGTTSAGYLVFPAVANQLTVNIINPNSSAIIVNQSHVWALPTFYRVTAKKVYANNNISIPNLVYTYAYTDAAVNDAAHSYAITNNESYEEAFTEFRGHASVTVIDPSGIKTITLYHQDDVFKGTAHNIEVKVNGNTRSKTFLYYFVNELAGFNSGTKWVRRYWTRPDANEYWAYNNSNGVVAQTKTVFNYESTYGNLTWQKEQMLSGGNWVDYRKTDYAYNPNNSDTKYLVSLPVSVTTSDGANQILNKTLYFYDGQTTPLAMPTAGVLTMQRTLLNSTLSLGWNQVSYDYDDGYGNQTTQTTWSGYGSDTQAPSTGVQTTTTEYDSIYHTYPTKVTNALGQFIEMGYDYAKGVPTSLTDLNGNTTTATYDDFGRITSITRPGDASPTLSMSYVDAYPYTTTITLNPLSYSVTRKYDGMGRQTQVNSGGTIVDTVYQSPTITKQSVPHTGSSPNLFTTTTVNPVANSTTITAPDNTFTTTVVNGLTTTVTDAKGYVTTSTADVWGRVSNVTPPTGPTVGYSYDVLGNLLTTTRGGATTTLTYDNAGRKKTMTDPDMGYWQYTYDALGNLKTQTDARNCVLTLGYDNLNRLTSKTSSGSGCGTQVNTSYGYDTGTNGIGQRTSMSDASGSTTWLYDIRGRMTKETKIINAQSFVTEYGYNSADLLTWMKYPDAEIVNYTYNSEMLLNSVYSSLGTYVQSTTYDLAGRIDNRVLGNGLTQDYNYYAWTQQGGRLENLTTGTLQNLSYQYDNAGNITNLTNNTASETNVYEYDELHRLKKWTLNGVIETYTYDANGNLDVKAGVDLNYNDASHKHAATHIGATQKYWYDANGNQTTRVIGADTFNLIYDAENRIVEVKKNNVSIAQFTYDGDGRRVKAIENGVTTLFVGSHYEVKGSEITKYYFAGTSRIAMRKYTVPVSMSVEYFLSDHLGSTSITTDNAGAKVSEMRYKPWGEVRYSWTAPQTTTPAYTLPKFTFTGQYSYMDDPSTSGVTEGFGLMFYNARWYDPSLGRFAQADSIIPPGVQGLDRYAYVNNSPMNYVDPSGHEPGNHCDRGYCDGDGNIIMANPLTGCRIHCSRDEIAETTLEQRLEWVEYLRGEIDNSFYPGAGDWFLNIQTVVEGFSVTGQDSNNWVLTVDVDILYAVQEGLATYTEGGTPKTKGGQEWYIFFEKLDRGDPDKDLINQWGRAEYYGTNDGLAHAGMPGFGDDLGFLIIGSAYRIAHFSLCKASDCVQGYGGFFNPKTTINSMASSMFGVPASVPYGDRSPVALALYPIYYGDYLGVK